MSLKINNRFKPQMENLEAREMLDAKMAPMLPMPVLQPALHGVMSTPTIQVNSAAPTLKAASPSVVFDGPTYYSVVTLRNDTNATIGFEIRWPGYTGWTTYTLKAHTTDYFWIAKSNVSAQIDYDKSFASGWQDQVYNLPADNFTGGGFAGIVPQASNGKLYHFLYNSNDSGVQLYTE